jgi:peroxiredoxin
MYRLETGLDVGDFAPEFSLADTEGKMVTLTSFKGKRNVLLAFYRGESDLYSINWLNALKDDYLGIRGLDTEVIAISADKANEEIFMKEKYEIPFALLPDPGCKVIKMYRVSDDYTHTATCAAFIIDREGKIYHKYVSRAPPDLPDNTELIRILRQLE